MKIWRHEWNLNRKTLLIWSLCVGGLCLVCIMMYGSLEKSIDDMAGMFANMGSFSAAFGMDKISIATLEGYYATEIAILFLLGGAMFAALTGATMVAKEEEGHTSEFINTLPIGRTQLILEKYAAMATLIVVFQIICLVFVLLGFAYMDHMPDWKSFAVFHASALLMQLEVGSVCFLLSAILKKKPVGMALGLAVLLYLMDMMCRIVPAMEYVRYITPYYYCNGADIFSGTPAAAGIFMIAVFVWVISLFAAVFIYRKRDLAA